RYWLSPDWSFQSLPLHPRRTLHDRPHIQTHDRCGQQSDWREHRKPSAHVLRNIEYLLLSKFIGLAEFAQLAARAGHRHEELAQPFPTRAVILGRFAAQDAVGRRGLQSISGVPNHDHSPTLFPNLGVDTARLQEV